MITGVVKVGHMKKGSSEKMNVWFGKFCSTVDKKGRSQYIFHNSTNVFEINNIFSDRVIFFISTTIFQINNFFSNLKTSQIEKSFLNQHKNETSRNMFQIQKKIEILKSFSKPPPPKKKIKPFNLFKIHPKMKTDKSFWNPQNNKKSTNLLEIFLRPKNMQVQSLK